jgi:Fe-S-cluster-containing hydrogenase component 2/thioredoxin reductase/CRP-like cAMP-binding protein
VKIAIVGSGPAGLSAAICAAELGADHILLEKEEHLADTIYKYSKGKKVMAEPSRLPLHPGLPFEAGSREKVLKGWQEAFDKAGVTVQMGARVTRIEGIEGDFKLIVKGKDEPISATHIVLATGASIPKEFDPAVVEERAPLMYELADPAALRGESVVVIGAGDAGIENALSLAGRMDGGPPLASVTLIVRDDEYARARDGNRAQILRAIAEKAINRVKGKTAAITRRGVKLDHGEFIRCDRVIARIGGGRGTDLLKSSRIELQKIPVLGKPGEFDEIPRTDDELKTLVPGIYTIGSLSGSSSLIKEAINHGREVVHRILEKELVPADQKPLEAIVGRVKGKATVDDILDRMRGFGLFSKLNKLQLREALLESELKSLAPGKNVYERGDSGDTLFHVMEGEVTLLEPGMPPRPIAAGEFFGEHALISGRPHKETARITRQAVILSSARRTILKLRSMPAGEHMKAVMFERQFKRLMPPTASDAPLPDLGAVASLKELNRGAPLFREGEPIDAIYAINVGTVAITRTVNGRSAKLRYVAAGEMIGAEALFLSDKTQSTTAEAVTYVEATRFEIGPFREMLGANPGARKALTEMAANANYQRRDDQLADALLFKNYAVGTNLLLIDEAICIGCDNCERACAATHGDGISRLQRKSGPTSGSLRAPISCLHCETPDCMKECPPNVIRRLESGEIVIEEGCISCGNCQRNCPFGVIQMAAPQPSFGGMLQRLLGMGGDDKAKAVKCDLCFGSSEGPACVHACPTGAAIRLPAKDFVQAAG